MDTYGIVIIISFTVITIIDLYLIKTSQEGKRVWTKPLIIPILALLYIYFIKQINITLLLALFFSFAGDTFLLFSEKKLFFQLGLFSFLTSHILYICTFTAHLSLEMIPVTTYILLTIPYLVYALGFLKTLRPYIGHYLIPVILYVVTIVGMSYTSLLRFWFIQGLSFWLPFLGSLFFVISDSQLAIRNFRYGQKKGWVTVMLTYVLGQLLIVLGFMK